jgi:hypothetical protein
MTDPSSRWRAAALAAASLIPLSPARAQPTVEELLQRLEAQEREDSSRLASIASERNQFCDRRLAAVVRPRMSAKCACEVRLLLAESSGRRPSPFPGRRGAHQSLP